MDIDRYSAAVVANRHRFARMHDDLDVIAIARQGFVNGVVHQFLHHVMQAGAVVRVADIHARTLANRIQAPQYLDIA